MTSVGNQGPRNPNRRVSRQTISSVIALILALANHPEVQQKATAELDLVVGLDRLPTMADQPMLPYVQAIVKETLRWFTVVPMGTSPTEEFLS